MRSTTATTRTTGIKALLTVPHAATRPGFAVEAAHTPSQTTNNTRAAPRDVDIAHRARPPRAYVRLPRVSQPPDATASLTTIARSPTDGPGHATHVDDRRGAADGADAEHLSVRRALPRTPPPPNTHTHPAAVPVRAEADRGCAPHRSPLTCRARPVRLGCGTATATAPTVFNSVQSPLVRPCGPAPTGHSAESQHLQTSTTTH